MHTLNIATHVLAGSIGILIGIYLLTADKGTAHHRRVGRVFVGFTAVVCLTAVLGTVFFRFIPLFAVLSLLVPYVLLSGWNVIYTRDSGPNRVDAALLIAAIVITIGLVPVLLSAARVPGSSAPVVFSTMGALGFVLAYDAARWLFPKRWHKVTWRLEHIYKILSALFGMMSAAIGNIFHTTWAQLAPSAIGLTLVFWFMWREWRTSASNLTRESR